MGRGGKRGGREFVLCPRKKKKLAPMTDTRHRQIDRWITSHQRMGSKGMIKTMERNFQQRTNNRELWQTDWKNQNSADAVFPTVFLWLGVVFSD